MKKNKKKVVVVGGGNGSAVAIVALKQNLDKFDIAAVASMSDSAGSTGRLRREFKMPPPGDIMRAVLAMSRYDYPLLRDIFYRARFSGLGKIDGHDIGNLFLWAVWEYGGKNFVKAVRALEQGVAAVGRVFPATLADCELCARLSNGRVVKTEEKIDRPAYRRGWKIKKVWLEPTVKMYAPVKKEILSADYIVFSPGSLYTSVIAAFLPRGFKEAIKKTHARLIYVSGNAYTKNGETGPETFSEIVKTLESYLPRPLDLVIYNNHRLSEAQKKKYREKKWAVFPCDRRNLSGQRVVLADYERAAGGLCAVKLSRIFKKYLI